MVIRSMRNNELLRSQVYADLKRDILHGLYKGGEQLAASELAIRYSISITPVRDALNALHQEGLVDILPRIGYFVSQISMKDIQDVFELRLILEGAAAEKAAQNISEEELQILEKIPSDYIPGNDDSYMAYLIYNRDFHYRIALASRNRWLAEMIAKTLDQVQRMVYLGLNFIDYTDDIINHHPRVVAALRSRDGAEARRIMVEGLELTKQAALESALGGVNIPINPVERNQL
jgi:DNA-binding GntR family transcriptional regulator